MACTSESELDHKLHERRYEQMSSGSEESSTAFQIKQKLLAHQRQSPKTSK